MDNLKQLLIQLKTITLALDINLLVVYSGNSPIKHKEAYLRSLYLFFCCFNQIVTHQ